MESQNVDREAGNFTSENLQNRWTYDDEVVLLEFYKENSCLWNTEDPNYLHKQLRSGLIRKLAKEFDNRFSPDLIRMKFKNLRTVYQRELNQLNRWQANGNWRKKSTWKHIHRMSFLRNARKPHPLLPDKREVRHIAPEVVMQIISETPNDINAEPVHSDSDTSQILPELPDDYPAPCNFPDAEDFECVKAIQHVDSTDGFSSAQVTAKRNVVEVSLRSTGRQLEKTKAAIAQQKLVCQTQTSLHQPVTQTFGGIQEHVISEMVPVIRSSAVTNPSTVHPSGQSYTPVFNHVPSDDGELWFGKHVAATLRTMTQYNKELAKLKIQEVLFHHTVNE